jgi:hypothetical protein
MTAPAEPLLDPTEVMVGTANGPGLWIAPEGTEPPAVGEAFAAPWLSLGYTSDDGVTVGGDKTTESLTPWQSTAPIRTIITEVTRTVAFVLWQLNQTTLGLYFDSPVPAPDADGVTEFDVASSGGGLIYAVAVDARDGENCLRLIWRRANLDSTGDMQLTKGAAVPLDVTLSALDNNGSQLTVQQFPASLLTDTLTVTAEKTSAQSVADVQDDTEAVAAEPVSSGV